MGAFNIERVAALAGASKMTIYKMWPTKGVLALEGFASTVVGVVAMPNTGDFEADLTEQLLAYVRVLCDTPAGRVFAELVGASQTDSELASALRRVYSGPRRAYGLAVLRAAQERGDIRADADPEVLIDQLWGACLYRLMMPDHELTEDFAQVLVENLIEGVGQPAVPR